MTFSEKIKMPIFWTSVLRIATVFFIAVIIISLLFESFRSIISFDMQAVAEQNFTNGKWIKFFSTKAIISLVYSIWVTARNMK
jgi:hypothetical protein